ncbi:hypothetical protein EV652_102236 [Kribbella steppae]|uniref:Uncharacterized protein n=1 Tax=Kribbella steppae TaxID=2512223 RepID=A0A4R2HS65_9ACTN|nr:hypothetical protein [Kribbella steppae]TCO34171.1 hypothetical protein EV652_102236 [Kribbella steppae]
MTRAVPNRRPTGSDPDDDWAAALPWHEEARDEGQTIIRRHTVDLRDEAERIARRAGAVTVSQAFVRRASEHAGLYTPSGSSDVLLGIGGLLLGIAGGFGAALLITPVEVTTLLAVIAVLVVVAGTAAFTVGATLKMKRR